MNVTKGLILILLLASLSVLNAQRLHNKTLLTIDGQAYDAQTFINAYLKNIDVVKDESQKDIDSYLQLYIDYRLKLDQARSLGLDQNNTYLEELSSHRKSLAQSYLTDSQVTDQLVLEAYQRSTRELEVSHILSKVSLAASPQDTLKAWNKINTIKQQLDNQGDFANLARAHSDGPSAGRKGYLGWMTVFKMLYDFETVAYNTPVGSYSDIFRTSYGYHILKVHNERPARGTIKVKHIMTYDARDAREQTAQQRINTIYKQLQQSGHFESLAREFSDDNSSAAKGGELRVFGTGGMNTPVFEDAAFGLNNPGDYTAPFKTKYGWHIIKLVEKTPIDSYEDSKSELRNRIRKSPRSHQINDAFNKRLRKHYNVNRSIQAVNRIDTIIDETFLVGDWQYDPEHISNSQQLFVVGDSVITYGNLYQFIDQYQPKDKNTYASKRKKVEKYYNDYIDHTLRQYYEQHLESENQEFKNVFNDYKEGLLIYDLLQHQVWDKAKKDSIAQQQYYNTHGNKYQWKTRIDLIITQSDTHNTAQRVQQLLEQDIDNKQIAEQINVDNQVKVTLSNGVVETDHHRIPEDFEIKLGVSNIYFDDQTGFYKVIKVNKIIEPTHKTLDEARGNVILDLQQQIEQEWLKSLRKGKNIEIDKRVLKKVKKAIAKHV